MSTDATLFDPEAEKQVAGIAAGWHKHLAHVRATLKPQHISDLAMQACYVTGLEMLQDGLPEDPVLFAERLAKHAGDEKLDLHFISKITNNVQSVAHLAYYADIVIEKAQRRERLEFFTRAGKLLSDGADLATVDERCAKFLSECEPAAKDRIGSFSAMAKKKENQALNPVVIDGIVREGETINIVSDSKVGKTWFVHLLALSICAGLDWLGMMLEQGRVLLLDNELHEPTLVSRIRQIARALNLDEADYAENLDVECFRGRLVDIHAVVAMLSRIPKGKYKVVILDSLYRFAPEGFNENDNAHTTAMYNLLDSAAARLGCAIVCVRHSSKGSQSNKSVIDTGAGAGAQARAVDCHLVLRAHEEEGAFVMAAALRSFAKLEPIVVRFEWPLFFAAPELDPEMLAPDKPKRKAKADDSSGSGILEAGWTADRFVTEFITNKPQSRDAIIEAAIKGGLSKARASVFMRIAEGNGTAHLHRGADRRLKLYANVPQFVIADTPEVVA